MRWESLGTILVAGVALASYRPAPRIWTLRDTVTERVVGTSFRGKVPRGTRAVLFATGCGSCGQEFPMERLEGLRIEHLVVVSEYPPSANFAKWVSAGAQNLVEPRFPSQTPMVCYLNPDQTVARVGFDPTAELEVLRAWL